MLGNAVKISTLYGVDIKIDASWLLIAGLIVWSLSIGYFPDRLPDASSAGVLAAAVVSMLGLFGSLILHELAHAAVARRHGVATTGITLFLFGGVAELEPTPRTPTRSCASPAPGRLPASPFPVLCWVAAAGAGQLGAGASASGAAAGAGAAATAILGYLAVVNMWLALFNLLPAFPLDGGRVFRAILRKRGYSAVSATRRAVGITSVVSWVLIALGISTLFTGGSGVRTVARAGRGVPAGDRTRRADPGRDRARPGCAPRRGSDDPPPLLRPPRPDPCPNWSTGCFWPMASALPR